MLVISIDGACRRNGKPNCVSAGGVFIMHYNNTLELTHTALKSNYELESTNQRGEMLALLTAIDYVYDSKQSAQVITDSEYLFNTMTKNWVGNWRTRAGLLLQVSLLRTRTSGFRLSMLMTDAWPMG